MFDKNDPTERSLSDMNEGKRAVGPFSRVKPFFENHPAFAVSILYVAVTGIGMLYSWVLYRKFGVNIVDFSEANDFLLVAFKQPRTLFLALGCAIYGLVGWWMCETRFVQKSDRMKRILGRAYAALGVPLMVLATWFQATADAAAIKDGRVQTYLVALQRTGEGAESPPMPRELQLIGFTDKFCFLYGKYKENKGVQGRQDGVFVIPVGNIARMSALDPQEEVVQ